MKTKALLSLALLSVSILFVGCKDNQDSELTPQRDRYYRSDYKAYVPTATPYSDAECTDLDEQYDPNLQRSSAKYVFSLERNQCQVDQRTEPYDQR